MSCEFSEAAAQGAAPPLDEGGARGVVAWQECDDVYRDSDLALGRGMRPPADHHSHKPCVTCRRAAPQG